MGILSRRNPFFSGLMCELFWGTVQTIPVMSDVSVTQNTQNSVWVLLLSVLTLCLILVLIKAVPDSGANRLN